MIKNDHNVIIKGKYINLREAEIEDSAFILSLRTDPKKSRFIHSTSPDIEKQRDYMRRYKTLENEWYFIVEDKSGNPVGVSSIYPYPILVNHWRDEKTGLGILGPGRWLAKDNISPFYTLECDYLVKDFFFNVLNMKLHPMWIHHDNKTVIEFQKKWGAKIIGFNDEMKHHILELTKDDYLVNLHKFKKFIYR